MHRRQSSTVGKLAIRIAAAGLGSALAGPLGGVIGAAWGDSFSGHLGELVKEFAKKGAEKLFDAGGDTLAEKVKSSGGDLGEVYREALRLSLRRFPKNIRLEFQDWFNHWEMCLNAEVTLELDALRSDQLRSTLIDTLLRSAMVRLDAQGASIQAGSTQLTLIEREMPQDLEAALRLSLPGAFDESFKSLLTGEEYGAAYRLLMLLLQERSSAALARVERDVALVPLVVSEVHLMRDELRTELRQTATAIFEQNARQGRVTDQQLAEKDAVIAYQAQQLFKLQQELAARATEPAEVRLEELVKAGNLDKALHLKQQTIERRETEASKLPRDYSEMGRIHKLRFEWDKALDAYREAWKLEPNWEYGFQLAYFADKQLHLAEAIHVYEAAKLLAPDRALEATVLNNLAILYTATQRTRDAEQAYDEALSVRRELAKQNPDAYLSDLVVTLNNLANLYRDTQRMQDAEQAYGETLSTSRELAKQNPQAYLPDVAMTLNNLAILYRRTQRMHEAKQAYGEALANYRELAKENPKEYLPYVPIILNNLAVVYRRTQRMRKAKQAFTEALTTYRELATKNPEAYLPNMANTLNNLATLYSVTQRMREADQAYCEALSTYRELAKENPKAYLPNVAVTLNNLAIHYRDTQRSEEAKAHCEEAELLLRPLWRENHEVHGDQMARILWMMANIRGEVEDRAIEACDLAREALEIAYSAEIKATIEVSIQRWCSNAK